MKNREQNKPQYKQLINKLFVKTMLLFIIAILIVFLIRSLVQGRLGDSIMRVLQVIYGLDSGVAEMAYHYRIRQHYDLLIVATIMIFFAGFYKIFLTWFTKYFDELITGIRGIEKGEQITLSKELHFIEVTMNQIKDQLIKNEEDKRLIEERKNDLVVYLAHDIKTPLTSIIGYLDLLEENQEMTFEDRKRYTHIAREKANRLEKLINEFFEITQYNTNAVPIKKEEIDLGYMMVQIVDEAYPILKEKEKKVEVLIPDELTVFADSEKLSRVFNNILKNAIYYSQNKSVIKISAFEEEKSINIEFQSQGEISKDSIHSIFDKFSRLDKARQSSTGGAGLGLAIAKDIVELHDGKIIAESKNSKTIILINLPKDNN